MGNLFRKIAATLILALISSVVLYAQPIDDSFWNDPKIIWKTDNGSIITSAFARKLHTQGNYTFQERKMRGGRREIKLVPSDEPKPIAKNINWYDPNVTFKDENGEAISLEVSRFLIELNSISWQSDTLESGLVEVVMKRNRKTAWDPPNVAIVKEWIDQWKGKPLPNFNLRDLNGDIVTNATLKNKILVINFWYTDCGSCTRDMQKLNSVSSSFHHPDVVFLAPSFESSGAINHFLERNQFNYSILSSAQPFMDALELQFYPAHMIVDADGTIVEINVGGDPYIDEDLSEKLSLLLRN